MLLLQRQLGAGGALVAASARVLRRPTGSALRQRLPSFRGGAARWQLLRLRFRPHTPKRAALCMQALPCAPSQWADSGAARAADGRAGHGDRGRAVRPAAARRPLVCQRGPPRAAGAVAHARAGARRRAALAPEHAAGGPGAAASGRGRGGAAWVKPWQGASAGPRGI